MYSLIYFFWKFDKDDFIEINLILDAILYFIYLLNFIHNLRKGFEPLNMFDTIILIFLLFINILTFITIKKFLKTENYRIIHLKIISCFKIFFILFFFYELKRCIFLILDKLETNKIIKKISILWDKENKEPNDIFYFLYVIFILIFFLLIVNYVKFVYIIIEYNFNYEKKYKKLEEELENN